MPGAASCSLGSKQTFVFAKKTRWHKGSAGLKFVRFVSHPANGVAD